MGIRQRIWAAKAQRVLRRQLGMKCGNCGSKFYRKLEFDVINGDGYGERHHRMEWSWRISFYRAEHKKGNLQLLCDRCHAIKTSYENYSIPLPKNYRAQVLSQMQ